MSLQVGGFSGSEPGGPSRPKSGEDMEHTGAGSSSWEEDQEQGYLTPGGSHAHASGLCGS